MVKKQSLIRLYIFSQKNEDVGNAEMLVSTPAQVIFSTRNDLYEWHVLVVVWKPTRHLSNRCDAIATP